MRSVYQPLVFAQPEIAEGGGAEVPLAQQSKWIGCVCEDIRVYDLDAIQRRRNAR